MGTAASVPCACPFPCPLPGQCHFFDKLNPLLNERAVRSVLSGRFSLGRAFGGSSASAAASLADPTAKSVLLLDSAGNVFDLGLMLALALASPPLPPLLPRSIAGATIPSCCACASTPFGISVLSLPRAAAAAIALSTDRLSVPDAEEPEPELEVELRPSIVLGLASIVEERLSYSVFFTGMTTPRVYTPSREKRGVGSSNIQFDVFFWPWAEVRLGRAVPLPMLVLELLELAVGFSRELLLSPGTNIEVVRRARSAPNSDALMPARREPGAPCVRADSWAASISRASASELADACFNIEGRAGCE